MIFTLAVAVIKDPAVIFEARREIQPYVAQLSDPKAEEEFDAALKSSDGQARVEQNKTVIDEAAKEIRALLTDVVSPAVRDSLVEAFSRASTLLIARRRQPVLVVSRLRVPQGSLLAGAAALFFGAQGRPATGYHRSTGRMKI